MKKSIYRLILLNSFRKRKIKRVPIHEKHFLINKTLVIMSSSKTRIKYLGSIIMLIFFHFFKVSDTKSSREILCNENMNITITYFNNKRHELYTIFSFIMLL